MTRLDAPQVDVAILTALAVEETAVVDAIAGCLVYRWRGLSLHFGDIAGRPVLVFPIGGVGNARAAQAAERVIGAWNPALLVLVGIAGGIPIAPAEMRPGDILVADQVVGYEAAKVTPGGTMRHFEVYRPDAELVAQACGLQSSGWADAIVIPRPGDPGDRVSPLVHTGPMLTGDKVLADGRTVADLRQAWPKAIGIEMEGLGVALAAHQNRVGFLIVKAVSDFADDRKDDRWHGYAAAAAARFAVAVLASSPDDEATAVPLDEGGATATAGPSSAERMPGGGTGAQVALGSQISQVQDVTGSTITTTFGGHPPGAEHSRQRRGHPSR